MIEGETLRIYSSLFLALLGVFNLLYDSGLIYFSLVLWIAAAYIYFREDKSTEFKFIRELWRDFKKEKGKVEDPLEELEKEINEVDMNE